MNTKKNSGSFRTSGETIIARECRTVPGFTETYQTLERTLTLRQCSKSAMQNYGRSIANVALHFGIYPVDLSIEQINDFLYAMLKTNTSPNKSYLRHTVYGLKCLFKIMGNQEKALKMPPIRDNDTMPVVLSKQEIKRLLSLTANLKYLVFHWAGLRLCCLFFSVMTHGCIFSLNLHLTYRQ
jgi:integrase/recombinase XerD